MYFKSIPLRVVCIFLFSVFRYDVITMTQIHFCIFQQQKTLYTQRNKEILKTLRKKSSQIVDHDLKRVLKGYKSLNLTPLKVSPRESTCVLSMTEFGLNLFDGFDDLIFAPK